MKRKITLLFVSLICCIACILSLSACDKSDSANSTKSTEVTALFVSSTFNGSYSTGDNSPYGSVTTTDYTFNFISETEVKVKYETTVKYGSFFEGKLDDEYSTSTYTRKYKIKVYNDGTSYIFIETFGSDGVNVSDNNKAFGKINFVEKSGEPYSIEAKDFTIKNLEIGYPTPNLTDKYAGYHEHIYSTSWSFDSENHWHQCTICNKKEISPHTLTNNTCSICNYDAEIDIFIFSKNNNGYELSGVRDTTRKELIIPASYKGLPVNTIGSESFSRCCELTSITIPDSVTSIGDSAFSYCSGLTGITIPDSVTSIGVRAFQGCSGLTSINIPDSVTYIGKMAFSWCDSLTNINIGTNVKSIGEYAFQNCPIETATIPTLACAQIKNKNLKSVIITSGNCIRKYALSGCGALTNVIISDSVTSIEENAFYDCSGLESITVGENNSAYASQDGILYNKAKTEFIYKPQAIKGAVTIPDSVTSIGNYAFSGHSGLTSITIPDSVTWIGDSSFSGCSGLTSITIPDSVTWIGWDAFKDCSQLTSITIPDSVIRIYQRAFDGCTSLTNVTFINKENWVVEYNFNKKNLTIEELSDTVQAANYLTDKYCNYQWTNE